MMSKSIIWTLFNIKCQRREGENERERKKKGREIKRVMETEINYKISPLCGSQWHLVDILLLVFLVGKAPQKIEFN